MQYKNQEKVCSFSLGTNPVASRTFNAETEQNVYPGVDSYSQEVGKKRGG